MPGHPMSTTPPLGSGVSVDLDSRSLSISFFAVTYSGRTSRVLLGGWSPEPETASAEAWTGYNAARETNIKRSKDPTHRVRGEPSSGGRGGSPPNHPSSHKLVSSSGRGTSIVCSA